MQRGSRCNEDQAATRMKMQRGSRYNEDQDATSGFPPLMVAPSRKKFNGVECLGQPDINASKQFIIWHLVISNFSVDGRISKTPLNVRGVLIEEAGIMEIGAVDGRFFPMRPKLSGNGRSCRTHLGTSL